MTYARDAMGRVSSVTTQQNAAAVAQTVVWNLAWNPYGPLASMSFGYGGVATFTTDTDYRITRVQVGATGNLGGTLDRSLSWTGDIVNSIVDNVNPGTTPPFTYTAQTQSFAYTPTRRLASASGYYGALSWTYDANGNRASETANGLTSTYAYPAGSNRLTSVTPAGQTARAFAYDASGDILTDSRTGALGMTFQYDVEGRLSKAYQTGAPAQGGAYAYDAQDRLASRTYTSGSTTTKASSYQLKQAGIGNPHNYKTEYGAIPNSRFDICACKDGRIIIKDAGSCGKPGPAIDTFERWK